MSMRNIQGVTAAHIHGGPGGFANAVGVLVAISAASSYRNAVYTVAPESCGLLLFGNAYLNIHTTANAGGVCVSACAS